MAKSSDKDDLSKNSETAKVPARRLGRGRPLRPVSHVLNKLVSGLGLDQRLRENTLMNLWPVLVGSPWDKKTRPLFIDHERNLVVSVSDASTGQELSFLKPQILKKLKAAAANLAVNLTGLRLDLKQFHARPIMEIELLPQTAVRPNPSEAELNALSLAEDELAQIQALRVDLLSSESEGGDRTFGGISAERIMKAFEQELRMRRWRRLNGFPSCLRCQIPCEVLQGEQLCAACYLDSGGYGQPKKGQAD